ncbi:MAG: hypothetical protein ACQESF_01910 [Nanobdellota archaeon]
MGFFDKLIGRKGSQNDSRESTLQDSEPLYPYQNQGQQRVGLTDGLDSPSQLDTGSSYADSVKSDYLAQQQSSQRGNFTDLNATDNSAETGQGNTYSEGMQVREMPTEAQRFQEKISQNPGNIEKDLEIISTKLDALKSTIENVDQRVRKIEKIAEQENNQNKTYKW